MIFHTFAKALKLVVAIIAKIYTLHNFPPKKMTAVITNAPNISSFCNIGRALLHEKASGGTVDANGAERRGNQDGEHRH